MMLHALESPIAAETARNLRSDSGAAVEVAETAEGERLRVRDSAGAILFEYDPASGRSVLRVPEGNLSVETQGVLDLVGARGVRIASGGPVSIESATAVQAGVTRGGVFAGLRALPERLVLSGRRLAVAAARADLDLEHARYRGADVDATVGEVRVHAHKLETVAERVISRARNVFERVEKLKQLRVGRLRTLVDDSIDFRAKSATLVTQKEVRIDGERIHLG